MTGDCHVRFYESRGVRFPPATHQVTKIARMLEQAVERDPATAPAKIVGGPARFARDASEFGVTR